MNASEPRRPPPRDGVNASCVALPPGSWPTVLDFLCERFAAVGRAQWLQRMHAGCVIDEFGLPVTPQRAYHSPLRVYYYRAVPAEARVPFEESVVHQDAHLVVADKPHFLPVVPSGNYLHETLLLRLQRRLGQPELAPLHRIDRDTAGLVLFAVRPEERHAYAALFAQRLVSKVYEAIAPHRPDLSWPVLRRSRIAAGAHFLLQEEVPGAVNAITRIDCIETRGALARYRLEPLTGKRHQLRVHMAALGVPIVGDGLYPQLTPAGTPDYGQPLQLLAQSIAFTDPLGGQMRQYHSAQRLRWPDSI